MQKCIALETTDLTKLVTVEMMNSMLTKVYSLQAKDGLPIYDSRVAAAIACLVELYRQQKQLSWKCVPSELVFPVLDQRSIRTVKGLTENLIVGSHTRMDRKNTQQWVSASIKLGWIMQAVLDKASNLFADQKSRLHAFEASLFMMGYDVGSLKSNLPKHK